MRNTLVGGLLVVTLCLGTRGFGGDAYIAKGMADKGTHGLVNIATCWMELPVQAYHGYEEGLDRYNPDTPALSRTRGMIRGIFRGTYHTAGRLLLGVYQLAGFWSANHDSNAGTALKLNAEYAWQRGVDQTFSANDRWSSNIGNRYERGFYDFFGGVAEFPLQMRKGFVEDNAMKGFFRGVWFTTSRIYSGAYDLVGLFLPTTIEPEGFPFESERPWMDCGQKKAKKTAAKK